MPAANARVTTQGDLFDGDPAVGRGKSGRLERKVAATIRQAKADGFLGVYDEGMAQLAIDFARACDVAARIGGPNLPYAMQAAGRELRETLTRLRLDPTTRGAGGDAIDRLLDQLSRAEVGDPADTEPA